MKHYIKTLSLLVFVFMSLSFSACEDDDLDLYKEVVGEATDAVASLSVSLEEAAPGEVATIQYDYVNVAEDPAKKVEIFQIIGQEKTLLQTFDESSAQTDVEIEKEFSYTIPDVTGGTAITLQVQLSTTNPFPKLNNAVVTVVEPVPTAAFQRAESFYEDTVYARQSITLNYLFNGEEDVLFAGLDSVVMYQTIEGNQRRAIDTVSLNDVETANFSHSVIIPAGFDGQNIFYTAEVFSLYGENAAVNSDTFKIVTGTPLSTTILTLTDPKGSGIDLVNLATIATGGDDALKDLQLDSLTVDTLIINNAETNATTFLKTTGDVYEHATLEYITVTFEGNSGATDQIDNPVSGSVYIARLRDQEEYVIFTFKSIAKSPDGENVALEVEIKHL